MTNRIMELAYAYGNALATSATDTKEARAALLAEIERVSKDAERYDYLLTKRLGWLSRLAPIPCGKQTTKEAMSAALDAALGEKS